MSIATLNNYSRRVQGWIHKVRGGFSIIVGDDNDLTARRVCLNALFEESNGPCDQVAKIQQREQSHEIRPLNRRAVISTNAPTGLFGRDRRLARGSPPQSAPWDRTKRRIGTARAADTSCELPRSRFLASRPELALAPPRTRDARVIDRRPKRLFAWRRHRSTPAAARRRGSPYRELRPRPTASGLEQIDALMSCS